MEQKIFSMLCSPSPPPFHSESSQLVSMVASQGGAEAKAEAEGSQPTPRPSTDLSLSHSFNSQGLVLFSFPPSPPSEPPDIRNWFSSYKYDSPDSSGLPFERPGSCVGDSESTASFGEFERIPISKGKDEIFGHFNDERFVCERSNHSQIQIQTQQGESSPNGGLVAMDRDQKEQNGSEGLGISEQGDGDQECGLPQIMDILINRHEQSPKLVPVDSPFEEESLDGRGSGRSSLLVLGSYDSEVNCKTCSREDLLQGNRRRQGGWVNVIADGPMPLPQGENSNENAGDFTGCWVSTRDYRHPSASDEDVLHGDMILRDRKHLHVERRVSAAIRTALADTTNHLNEPSGGTKAAENPGKWQCPRKNRPERAPPLKQLRLDCWVRRVV